MVFRQNRYTLAMLTPAAAARPLLVRLCNWVGEVVLLVPALERLAQAGYTLTLYGRPWAQTLLEAYPWQFIARPNSLAASRRRLAEWRRAYAQKPPALLFTKSLSSAIETRLAGLRPYGYAYDGRAILLRKAYRYRRQNHAVDDYWQLTNEFLGTDLASPTFWQWRASEAQQRAAEQLLAQHGLLGSNTVMLCPFAGKDDKHKRKHWPGFSELAAALRRDGRSLLICPGPDEETAAATLFPTAVRLPGINLGVYGALMTRMAAIVANDTGPGHLAAAAGARLISLYGPHSRSYWWPRGQQVTLLVNSQQWPDPATVYAQVRQRLDSA
jgi:heptosyltransferase II